MFKSALRRLIPLADRVVSTRAVQRYIGSFIPIFMLHRLQHPDLGISGQSVDELRQSLDYFRKRGYRAISLQELGETLQRGAAPPPGAAVFTIDDGFIDHHDIAAPLFAEYDIPLTFFLVTGFIDGECWPWDDQLSYALMQADAGDYRFSLHGIDVDLNLDSPAARAAAISHLRHIMKQHDNTDIYATTAALFAAVGVEQPADAPLQFSPMSWNQADTLVSRGHCIAAHTRTHRILSRLNDADAEAEIGGSIARVDEMIGEPSRVFAYPTGRRSDFGARETGIMRRQNILATVSTISAPCIYNNGIANEMHKLPRFAMPSSLTDFIQYLGWIEYVKFRLRRQ